MPKHLKIFLIFLFLHPTSNSQTLYFPPLNGNTWDTLSPAGIGWCLPYVDSLYTYLDQNNTKAFLLLKNGKIVLEKYFGSFTQDSVWYWASAGKTLTAFAVGIAQQEGFLNLQDSSSMYLGTGWTIAPPQKEKLITILDQLRMSSGLDDNVPDHYCTLDTCLKYLADAGTRWAYHNGPYTLLDSVIENATSMTLNQWITQKIKNPTGMTGAFFPSGFNNVFYSKARSMARFGLLLLNKGKWNTTPVLTDSIFFNAMTTSSQIMNPSYGYLTWLNGKTSFQLPGSQFSFPGSLMPDAPSDMYAALGKNGQLINVVPSSGLVMVRMGDTPNGAEVSTLFNDTIWIKLKQIMCEPNTLNISNEFPFQLYPNPAGNFIRFNVNQSGWFELYDLLGVKRIVQRIQIGEQSIALHNLAGGSYYIVFISDDRKKPVVRYRLQVNQL